MIFNFQLSTFNPIENKKTQTGLTRRAVRRPYSDSRRQGASGSTPTAARATHTARTGARPATNIAVRPARTEAGDSTGSVASWAAREVSGHGAVVIHNRLKHNRSGEDAETRRQLSEHDRTHILRDLTANGEREEKRGFEGLQICVVLFWFCEKLEDG